MFQKTLRLRISPASAKPPFLFLLIAHFILVETEDFSLLVGF